MYVQTFSYIGYFIAVQFGDIFQILPQYIKLTTHQNIQLTGGEN